MASLIRTRRSSPDRRALICSRSPGEMDVFCCSLRNVKAGTDHLISQLSLCRVFPDYASERGRFVFPAWTMQITEFYSHKTSKNGTELKTSNSEFVPGFLFRSFCADILFYRRIEGFPRYPVAFRSVQQIMDRNGPEDGGTGASLRGRPAELRNRGRMILC